MSVKRWTPVIRAGGSNVTAEIRPVSTTHEVAVLAREILDELEAALDGWGTTRHDGLAIALSQMRYSMSGEEDALRPVMLRPIGVIHSPHRRAEDTPIQPVYAPGVRGRAEILPEYADGLRNLEGFSHVFLIYWFPEASSPQLIVKPFLDDATHGVFATRAPCRAPAAAGWSTLTSKLLGCAAAGCVASMPVVTRVTAGEPPDNWLLMDAR
jgi:hypothetical protein